MSAYPQYRFILKLTGRIKKSETGQGSKRKLKDYLSKYVDEVGKATEKKIHPKSFGEKRPEKEINLLEEDTSLYSSKGKEGVIWAGGFLSKDDLRRRKMLSGEDIVEEFSPGNDQPNKQKGWIRRVTDTWIDLLGNSKYNKRRSDGHRFVMGLHPKGLEELNKSGMPVDRAMREIFCKFVELYKKQHEWEEEEMA